MDVAGGSTTHCIVRIKRFPPYEVAVGRNFILFSCVLMRDFIPNSQALRTTKVYVISQPPPPFSVLWIRD